MDSNYFKKTSVIVAALILIVALAVQLRDDLHQWLFDENVGVEYNDAISDKDLSRLSLKLYHYYSDGKVEDSPFCRQIEDAMISPKKARMFALGMEEMWYRRDWSQDRYNKLCFEIITRWMLRAARGGDTIAYLSLVLKRTARIPVRGLESPERCALALAELRNKEDLTWHECIIVYLCYTEGVGTQVDKTVAEMYLSRANAMSN